MHEGETIKSPQWITKEDKTKGRKSYKDPSANQTLFQIQGIKCIFQQRQNSFFLFLAPPVECNAHHSNYKSKKRRQTSACAVCQVAYCWSTPADKSLIPSFCIWKRRMLPLPPLSSIKENAATASYSGNGGALIKQEWHIRESVSLLFYSLLLSSPAENEGR